MNKFTLKYAGHSAVFLEIGGLVVAIDPWLKGNPLCPPELHTPDKCDLIVLTHGHSDHASDALRVQKHTGALLAATYELAMIMLAEGIPEDKIIPMNKGGVAHVKGITVRLTDALHSSSFEGENGSVYAGEACGVVLSDETNTLYHAGDTALFSDMRMIGELYKPSVALLPIGDRFTMGPIDAALAASWLGAKVTMPIHYKTFDLLSGTYSEFARECQRLDVTCQEMRIGHPLDLLQFSRNPEADRISLPS